MIERRYRRLLPVLLATASVAWAADGVPLGVSPGTPDVATTVATACPAFSWGGSADVGSWELVVYRAEEAATDREPVLRRRLPGGASSWTPALEQCLPAGGSFAWTVGAFIEGREPVFSRPLFFRTPAAPTVLELERALAVLEAWRQARGDPAEEARGSDGSAAAHRRPPAELPEGPGTSVAIRGASADTGVVGIGVEGTSASAEPGSAGLVGASSAATGDVAGLRASHQSPNGTAAELHAPNGGDLVRGSGPAGEVFSVDAAGNLAATSLTGEGAGLTGVDADTLDGLDASGFSLLSHDHFGQVWSGRGSDGLTVETNVGGGAAVVARATGSVLSVGVFAEATAAPGGVGGWFTNTGGGTALAAGFTGSDLPFTVSQEGEVAATSYQGDGSQLAGVVTGGQSCTPGQVIVGIGQDGSVQCGYLPLRTTTIIDSLGQVGTGSSIAIGVDGLPVVSYSATAGGAREVRVAACADLMCSSSTRSTIDEVADSTFATSIAIDSSGLPQVAYQDSATPNLLVARCQDSKCSIANSNVVATDSLGQVSLSVGSDGLPIIAYRSVGAEIKVAHCDDLACASATVETVADGGSSFAQPFLAIGSDGLPAVSYYDFTGPQDLHFAHCDDLVCSTATLRVIDAGGLAGQSSAWVVGAEGFPVISYNDITNGDLKVAVCEDISCASATLRVIDSDGTVGTYTSIVVGPEGLPIISYHDSTNLDVKIARCEEATCSAATLQVVDGPGDVGWNTSLALGADGLPIVAYYDIGRQDLKVAHCANPICS